MYEFTNGIIVFDKKTRDKMLSAGYKLVAAGDVVGKKTKIKDGELCIAPNELLNENTSINRIVKEQSKKCNKLSKQV